MYCDIHDIKQMHHEFSEEETSQDSNKTLLYLYKVNGDKTAKEKLILNNINLVRKIAFKKCKLCSFTYEDLVQEGIMGLIKGIEKFDINRKNEFSTYAYYWINQYIDRAIYDRGFLVRLPIHVIEKINKINKIEKEQLSDIGYIKKNTLCEKLSITLEEYEELKDYEDKIKKIVSLNQSINSEESVNDESQLIDLIPYSYSLTNFEYEDCSVEDKVYRKLLKGDIDKVLHTLSPREEKIIRDRFGLYEKKPKTLEEIGSYYKVTRERIRQIEAKAIRKLRHPSRTKSLRDYFI